MQPAYLARTAYNELGERLKAEIRTERFDFLWC